MASLGSTWLHLAPRGSTWLTKLGRCDSYTMKWLNNRTAKNSSSIARIHLAPSTWLHLAAHGSTWLHLVPTCFYWFSTDFYWPSTDSLLDCFRSAMCLNNWEQLGTFKATWCMDWIGLDHRPPLQLEHRWAVLIIKPFGTLKISVLQRFLVIVTTNIWILHCYNISRNCYNLFILLHRLFDVTILLQQLYVVTILLHRIACNCYNVFATGCNNGIFHCYACYNAMLQAFQTPCKDCIL